MDPLAHAGEGAPHWSGTRHRDRRRVDGRGDGARSRPARLDVVVLERGEVASGTTGRNHCLLHSGGRYCVTDEEAGVECIEENLALRRIMPDLIERNDGLFVATTEEDLAYRDPFLEACARSRIPARELTPGGPGRSSRS